MTTWYLVLVLLGSGSPSAVFEGPFNSKHQCVRYQTERIGRCSIGCVPADQIDAVKVDLEFTREDVACSVLQQRVYQ